MVPRVQFAGPCGLTLHSGNGLTKHPAVEVEADGGDLTALGCPEQVARTPDLQIAHGNPKTCAELRVLTDRLHPATSLPNHHHVAWKHQIGIGLLTTTADTPPELVEIGESEAVGAVDDDRVGIGDIKTAFDDRCGNQNIGLPFHEALHHSLQLPLLHLPVTDKHTRSGTEFTDPRRDLLDRADPVM